VRGRSLALPALNWPNVRPETGEKCNRSELATNALRHTRTGASGGTFSVRVETTPCRVRGEVHSGAPLHRHDTPHVFQADLGGLAEGGRGLALVDQLTTRWGSLPHAHGVYFLLHWPTPRT